MELLEKIYMAGPLFSEAEVNQRLIEARILQDVIIRNDLNHEVFSPINAPVNDKSKLPTAKAIFTGDEKELVNSTIIFADLSGEDAGVMMELGMMLGEEVLIFPYLSDIRMANSGSYKGHYVPFGYNQFVIGGLENYGHKVHFSFDSALKAYKKEFNIK